MGLEEQFIRDIVGTGLIVDIVGTGQEETVTRGVNAIAFRADMDALPIPEQTPDLEWRSETNAAHMCGHDGHVATLIASAGIFIKNRDKFPKGKIIRLLF